MIIFVSEKGIVITLDTYLSSGFRLPGLISL